ncbi:MAG TPA: hypothetical protein VLQ67_10105 [Arachnia sp.]|nr:hypothetical protein [Arachnia sp.]
MDGVGDPSLGLADDSITIEYGCRGVEDLFTDPRLFGGQSFAAPHEVILRHEAFLLTNGA